MEDKNGNLLRVDVALTECKWFISGVNCEGKEQKK